MGHRYNDNLGALLIGQMISTFLYGISTLQTYVYLIRFPRDSPELKIWWGMVSNGSVAGHESFAKRSFFASAVLNLVVAAVVQCFFIKRIHKYKLREIYTPAASGEKRTSHRHHFPIGTDETQSVFVIAHLALGACATVKVVSTFESTALESLSLIAFSAALPYTLLAVLSDAFIAGTLIQLSRGRTPEWDSPRVHTMAMQFVTFAINRCVLVTVAALVRLIAFTVLPWTAWFIATDFIMGKLYANSFVACLNARSLFPTPQASRGDTAIFSSVPDISVRSNGSINPPSHSPMPRRPASRAISLPDLVFCKTKLKPGVAGPSTSVTEREVCPCMLLETQ
ncbi:uncharacterized protein TRAVEDRAFT_48623 [Trametes versicolor FP-101664 SS1]|uniref:uncharacterized protein n=1 Tax=Trametes versicolor (strain FP-101664) TaxID=717944 RepID=UPI0004622AF5|nr:uncharacterized protein TRAVEDRAFT_48623 [Trametes versicolor FP-101664 SS1]EIW57589.1 hypothetical protein TRAVEDRAFT_48623 [Trametes versicolor FP-101664 SS1]